MKKVFVKLTLFAFALFLFVVFVLFSYLVGKKYFTHFDFNTTVRIQNHISPVFRLPFSMLSILGSAEVTLLIWLLLWIYFLLKRYWLTVIVMPIFVIGLLLEIFGKSFVFHPGPPHFFYKGMDLVSLPSQYISTDYSYPSGHVFRTSFLLLVIIIWIYLRPSLKNKQYLGYILGICLLVVMIISRVYLGEHWTSDVIGGLLLGSSFGILAGITIPYEKIININSQKSDDIV